MTQLIAEAETVFLNIGKLFLLRERQEMRMKHDESAEFPGCNGGCGVHHCQSTQKIDYLKGTDDYPIKRTNEDCISRSSRTRASQSNDHTCPQAESSWT